MDNSVCFLITLYYIDAEETLTCALKIDGDALPDSCIEWPLETSNKAMIHALLPDHVREVGPIVKVEQIFEVVAR